MRDRSTPRIDFCNQADNLAALITTSALAFDSSSANNIVGVSVLRSGASLEVGVQRVVRNIEFGSMLIQNDSESGEPRLININLPEVLRVAEAASKTTVLLLDSQIGTGAAALMAIRVLLDHGVEELNIIFCCFLVSRIGGIHPVSTNYPGVRIQTGDVDPGLEERYDIDPSTNKPKRVRIHFLPFLSS